MIRTFVLEKCVIKLTVWRHILFQPNGKTEADGDGHCVWYGTVYNVHRPQYISNGTFNIAYDGPAKRFDNDTASEELQSTCPELYEDLGMEITAMTTSEMCNRVLMPFVLFFSFFFYRRCQRCEICCSATQVADLKNNLKQITYYFGNCPSCVRNFRLLFCFMTCGPHQSKHLSAKTTHFDVDSNQTLITELNNFVEEEFALNLFDSCKEVRFGSIKAISFLCRNWFFGLCNADRLQYNFFS